METSGRLAVDLAIVLLLFLGISQFRSPRRARLGNLAGALALACALAMVLATRPITAPWVVLAAALVGSAAGWIVAARVSMVGIPAMIALQHGAGAAAALLVSFVELARDAALPLPAFARISGVLGLLTGAATLTGSLVASGKLAGVLRQAPAVLPRHRRILSALAFLAAAVASAAVAAASGGAAVALLVLAASSSLAFGAVFAIRIGGADMPVLISFLNATAGLAAAFCGLVVDSSLLVACGAAVAASGSVLTHVMCRAMNRSLAGLFLGTPVGATPRAPAPGPVVPQAPAQAAAQARAMDLASASAATPGATPHEPQGAVPVVVSEPSPAALEPSGSPLDPVEQAILALRDAHSVVVIPGYGMALAEAQDEVASLAEALSAMGKDVKFAIHPVAGRMPGHMHVLLAEAEVGYERLFEPDKVNPRLPETDIALIVGACDVVNPAAIDVPGTPISGMPILRAHEARRVIVCNLDRRPGYSGVANPLYDQAKTILVLGDAKESVGRILKGLETEAPAAR